jgi:multimeric flavodoxin WrbA
METQPSYLVALKDKRLRTNWYRNIPELDIELRNRIRRTKSGEPALKSFDAPSMKEYQVYLFVAPLWFPNSSAHSKSFTLDSSSRYLQRPSKQTTADIRLYLNMKNAKVYTASAIPM